MNRPLRSLFRAAPYALCGALAFWLLPHPNDAKGIAPPSWPAWERLDTVAVLVVWLGTAVLLLRLENGPGPTRPELAGEELHLLAFAAIKTTGITMLFAVIRWVLPSSRPWTTRGKGMPWFAFDSGEYQVLVGLWAVGFLCLAHKDLAELRRERSTAARLVPRDTVRRYEDPDWVELRRILLEASVGRQIRVPERLRDYQVAQLIERHFVTGDRSLLDRAAAELSGTGNDPWLTLKSGIKLMPEGETRRNI